MVERRTGPISQFTSNQVELDLDARVVRKIYVERSSFETELLVLEYLAQVGMNVPKVLSVGSKDLRPYLEMELIDGVPASLLDRDALSAALPVIGEVVRELHVKPPQASPLLRLRSRKLEDLLSRLKRLEKVVPVREIEHLFVRNRSLIEPEGPERCLVHRDIRLDNLIVDQSRKRVFVLDFERCVLGAPLSDLARFLTVELNDDVQLRKRFLQGYGISLARLESTKFIYDLIFAVEMLDFLTRDTAPIRSSQDLFNLLLSICRRAVES